MQTVSMNRRQFLKSSIIAATLAANGRLPLLAAETGSGLSIDASTGSCAVKPIRDHLSRFLPAEPHQSKWQHYTLTYDIIHWSWAKGKRGTYANSVIGQAVINRRAENDRIMYNISQQTRIGGVNNVIEAQIISNVNDISSLRSWRLRSYERGLNGEKDRLSELTEQGTCRGGKIRIESGDYHYEFDARNHVVSQWTIPDFLIQKASPQLDAKFDLLHDLSLFKPNQHLVYDGQIVVKCKGGQKVTLQTFAQTGQAILPIHYLIDAQRRPQLITSSILSWALSGQTNAVTPSLKICSVPKATEFPETSPTTALPKP